MSSVKYNLAYPVCVDVGRSAGNVRNTGNAKVTGHVVGGEDQETSIYIVRVPSTFSILAILQKKVNSSNNIFRS